MCDRNFNFIHYTCLLGYIDRKELIVGLITPLAVTKCSVSNSWNKSLQLRQRRAAARGAESGLEEAPQ